MKKLLLTLGLLTALFANPTCAPKAEAQAGWQCQQQTYCNYYGYCWVRTQCCAWITDAYGVTYWQCQWR